MNVEEMIKRYRKTGPDEWLHEAADALEAQKAEIERLWRAVDAAKEMADDYEVYELKGDDWFEYPLHDVGILERWKAAFKELDNETK